MRRFDISWLALILSAAALLMIITKIIVAAHG